MKDLDDIQIPFQNLQQELEKRNGIVGNEISSIPISVKYESKYMGNVTLIDTPGLRFDVSTHEKEERDKIVVELSKVTNRTLCCVEEACDWDNFRDIVEFAKKIDLKLTRSIFILSNFHKFMLKYNNPRDWAHYFARKPQDCKCFFVTMISKQCRDDCISKGEQSTVLYQTRLCQAWSRDWNYLENTLKFDKKKNEGVIGISQARNYTMELTWKSFKENIPELRKSLANAKKSFQDSLNSIQELYSIDYYRLRSIMSNYVADWLQVIVQLIDGSSEGIPSITGQNIEEEDVNSQLQWLDISNNLIQVPSFNLKTIDTRLYGGHQVERMLHIFKSIVSEYTSISNEEIKESATVAIKDKSNIFDNTLIASHISQKKCNNIYSPLIEQICNRCSYILKRLSDIAFTVLDNRRAARITSRTIADELNRLKGFR